jgi:hypothetical protein
MPVSGARNPVADRLVVIGDANTGRYLKNGVESSFYTAMWAAKAMLLRVLGARLQARLGMALAKATLRALARTR